MRTRLALALDVRRDPATGLAPGPAFPRQRLLDHAAVCEVIGSDTERERLADGYDVDAVLAASAEFRRTVGGLSWKWMTRGEALHIVRALAGVAR